MVMLDGQASKKAMKSDRSALCTLVEDPVLGATTVDGWQAHDALMAYRLSRSRGDPQQFAFGWSMPLSPNAGAEIIFSNRVGADDVVLHRQKVALHV
jgi:hypothetical protein